MQEITTVTKKKSKQIFRLSDEEFRTGKWCSDKAIVPDGAFVELSYTARNGILIVHNTTELQVKKIDEGAMPGEGNDEGKD